MSDFDPPPLPNPFMAPPYSDGNAGGFWPQFPMNGDYPYSYSQFEQPPLFKDSRNPENNAPNSFRSPHLSMKRDHLDSYCQFEQQPPFKRSTYSENNLTNFVPPAQSNPRMNPPNPPMNRGTTSMFYKTRPCLKFLEGNCKNGDSCNFAHGPEEQRKPPPNWQELVKDRGAGNWNDDKKIIYSMRLCKKFYNGEECPFGDRCNFRHVSPSKLRSDMAVEMTAERTRQGSLSIGDMGDMKPRSDNDCYDLNKHLYSNSDAFQVNINANSDALRVHENANSDALRPPSKTMFWKTRLCIKWQVGMCPFGERCNYAHGDSELRQLSNGHSDQSHENMMNNAGISAASYPSAVVTISDVPPTISAVAAPIIKEGGKVMKRFAKWDPNKKINRIYGDWIDDLSPPRNFPCKIED